MNYNYPLSTKITQPSRYHSQQHYTNGYLLIEILLALCISLLSITGLYHLKKQHHTLTLINSIQSSYQLFVYAKLRALHQNSDTYIRLSKQSLMIHQNNTTLYHLTLPKDIHAHINFRRYLGFKSNGNTKSPGRLTLSSQNNKKELRLGIGISKWTLY